MLIRQYSSISVNSGSIIEFDDDPGVKYKVISCISLELLDKAGYQLNLRRILQSS